MRAQEFLQEAIIGTITIQGIQVAVDDHALDRTVMRDVLPSDVDRVLRKLPTIQDQLQAIDPGQKFWVYDATQDVALGFRTGSKLLLKTVLGKRPYSSDIPVIEIN